MKKLTTSLSAFALAVLALTRCSDSGLNSPGQSQSPGQTVLDVAQTSGQLASGTSFRISGSSTDSTGDGHMPGPGHGPGPHGHARNKGILDGLNLLAPTDELLAIVDAESASDFSGLRISKNGGAAITNYDASGAVVSLPIPSGEGPQGCSFSGKQFPEYDSILGRIAKTVVDFGSGVTYHRDTVRITRSGKIVITRSKDNGTYTEVTTFDNYYVNGAKIEGTKTRITTFDATTGSGTSATTVTDGRITFSDGTVAAWTSNKKRSSDITLDSHGRPSGGSITTEVNTHVTAADGTVIYAHVTSEPLVENVACGARRHGPVSGVLDTVYRTDTLSVNYGDGTCENRTITITLNGITSTKTIGF